MNKKQHKSFSEAIDRLNQEMLEFEMTVAKVIGTLDHFQYAISGGKKAVEAAKQECINRIKVLGETAEPRQRNNSGIDEIS